MNIFTVKKHGTVIILKAIVFLKSKETADFLYVNCSGEKYNARQ